MSYRPLAIDLFSGCGGMSLGLEAAGFDIAAAVEIDPIHALVHHYNFPYGITLCQDIRQLNSYELLQKIRQKGFVGEIDLIAGGSPCQGFSLMGKRELDDPRNQLVFEYVRLISEIKPKYFIFENVPGLTSPKYKSLLRAIIDRLAEAGYSVTQPHQVLNASLYGAPQKRKRLILLGHRQDLQPLDYPCTVNQEKSSQELLGQERGKRNIHLQNNQTISFNSVQSAIGDLSKIPVFRGRDCGINPQKLVYRGSRASFALKNRGIYSLCHQRAIKKLVWGHLGSKHTETSIQRFDEALPGKKEAISHFYRLSAKGLANTLRAGTSRERGAHTAPRPIHYQHPRCITIREAARLHTFPDWFQFHRTIWHGFREIGNSVIPLLAKHLGSEVIRHLDVDLGSLPIRKLEPMDDDLLSYRMEQAARFWQVDEEIIPKRTRVLAKS